MKPLVDKILESIKQSVPIEEFIKIVHNTADADKLSINLGINKKQSHTYIDLIQDNEDDILVLSYEDIRYVIGEKQASSLKSKVSKDKDKFSHYRDMNELKSSSESIDLVNIVDGGDGESLDKEEYEQISKLCEYNNFSLKDKYICYIIRENDMFIVLVNKKICNKIDII